MTRPIINIRHYIILFLNQESDCQNFSLYKAQAKLYFGEFTLRYQCKRGEIRLQGPLEIFAGHFDSVSNLTDWESHINYHQYYIIIDGLAFHFR